jgi:glucose 1-dehydrogenase
MRVLVTGANRGVGRAIAERLVEIGADLGAVGRSHPEELEDLRAKVAAKGRRCVAISGDLAKPDDVAMMVAETVDQLGGLDAVVSNAAFSPPLIPFIEQQEKDWDRCYAVNLRAAFLLAKAAYPHLKTSRGAFIAISSINGCEPAPLRNIYGSSKAGLNMLMRCLAQEWAGDGIRANTVTPGMVHTPMSEEVFGNPVRLARRVRLVPLGRIGKPEETADAVAWLLSPGAALVTGQNLILDGAYLGSIQAHVASQPIWIKEKEKKA